MRSMIIGGIILIVALAGGTFFLAGDAFVSDDNINMLTMIGAVVIITITVATVLKYVNQIKNDTATGELAEENWDGIGEYTNEAPTGWRVLYILAGLYVFWYLVFGFPTDKFSQIGQYNNEVLEHKIKFEAKWAQINDSELEKMGKSIFFVNCAPCHGVDGEGINNLSQDFTSRMLAKDVKNVVINGSAALGDNPAGNLGYMLGAMPDRNGLYNATSGNMISDLEIESVAKFVSNGLKGEGADVFAGACASCHGANGKGNGAMAPNLASYDDTLVLNVLHAGKKGSLGSMPSFKNRLTDTQMKAVAKYIRSIGE